jgi:hypothetical protein
MSTGGAGLAQAQADLVRVRTPDYVYRRWDRSDVVLGVLALMPLPALYLVNWAVH